MQPQDGGGDRSDRGRAATQSDLASEGCACTPGGATDLSDPKPFHDTERPAVTCGQDQHPRTGTPGQLAVATTSSITGIRISINRISGPPNGSLSLTAMPGLPTNVESTATDHHFQPATDQLGGRDSWRPAFLDVAFKIDHWI